MNFSSLCLNKEDHSGLWLLVWIGRISKGPYDVYFVNIWLKRISNKIKDNKYDDKDSLEGEMICRTIEVGLLSTLTIGSVFDNYNNLVNTPELYCEYYNKVNLHNPSLLKCSINDQLKQDEYAYFFPGDNLESKFPFYSLIMKKDFKRGKGLENIVCLLTVNEVVRYFYFRHSKFIKPIITGILDDLYTKIYPIFIDDEGKRVAQVVLKEGLSNKEILDLAFILYSFKGMDGLKYIGNSIRYNILKNNEDSSYFKTHFPMKSNCVLETYGKFFTVNEQKYYLVYKIVSVISSNNYERKPFDEIIVEYTEERNSTPRRQEKDEKITSNIRLRPKYEADDMDIVNGDGNSLLGIKNISVENSPTQTSFFDKKGVTVNKIKRQDQEKKYIVRDNEFEFKIDSFTTELSGGRLSNSQKINIECNNDSTYFLDYPFFEYIIGTVRKLKSIDKYSFLALNNCKRDDVNLSLFPHSSNEFGFINLKNKIKRRVVVVELCVANKYFYLFEVERIHNNFSTPIIHSPDYRKVSEVILNEVLYYCAEYGGAWYQMYDDEIFETKLGLRNPNRFEHQVKGIENLDKMTTFAAKKIDSFIQKLIKKN